MTSLQVDRCIEQVFFSELKYTYIESTPSYSKLALLCDVGGALGLILGSTVLTLMEIVDLVLTMIFASVERPSRGNGAKPQRTATVLPAITVEDNAHEILTPQNVTRSNFVNSILSDV